MRELLATTTITSSDEQAVLGNARTSWREDVVTVALGTWLMAGLAVDGWAHNNLARLETFFTPWHALFYSGFTVTGAWILWISWRRRQPGRLLTDAIPEGYGLGVVGLALFGLGGVGDMIWHTIFGIEADIDALLSPTHLLLYLGAILILTSPLRAAWVRPGGTMGMKEFAPVLMSAALASGLTAFMFMYLSPFLDLDMSALETGFLREAFAGGNEGFAHFLNLRAGIAAIVLTTFILYSPALLLLRRWQTPMLSFTVMFAVVATLIQAVGAFSRPWLIAVAAIGGLGADLLAAKLRPSVDRPASFRLFAGLAPMLLWAVYVGATALTEGLGWELEVWTGVIIWSGILGLGLSVLMLPPAMPDRATES
jgi:hypothetical protein